MIFENVSSKGSFCDWIWRISNFPFWRQILDIYRRALLKRWSWKSWNLTKVVVCFSQSVEWTGECTLWSLKNLQVLIYSKLHEKNHVITYTKVIVLYCILLVLVNNKKKGRPKDLPIVPPLGVNIGLKTLEHIAVLTTRINEFYLHVKFFIIRLFTDPSRALSSKKIKCCLEKKLQGGIIKSI